MVVLTGFQRFVQILTIVFNFVVFICGLLLVSFAGYLLHLFNTTFPSIGSQEYGVFVGFIVLGALIVFLGFLGCCGAWKQSVCMLTTFAVVISILLVIQVIIAIIGFVYRDKIPELVRAAVEKAFKEGVQYPGGSPIMQAIERKFECCGLDGRSDYEDTVPSSCGSYTNGCAVTLENFVIKHSTTLFIVAIVVAVLQLAAVIVACCLQSQLKSYHTV